MADSPQYQNCARSINLGIPAPPTDLVNRYQQSLYMMSPHRSPDYSPNSTPPPESPAENPLNLAAQRVSNIRLTEQQLERFSASK